ncbi:MAG: Ig-like domain-containing protein, partial [Thermoplasmata archaeon]|nr:Ig-like domain-containing protein [Thermoplasmata archaeon]
VEGYAYNTPSTIDVTSVPYSGYVSTDGRITIEGNATDPEGIDTIILVFENTTLVDATGIGGYFLHEYTGLDNGTYVVEVRVTDNQGDVTSTWVLFTVDIPAPPVPQPPTGSIIINDGDEYSTSTTVTLALTYSGGSSAVSQVRYSNDGVWDTENWEAPAPTRSWTLESGDGAKTVYYQIENNDGLRSPTYSDDITLDTEMPDIFHVQPEDGSKDVQVTTTITLTFSEKMDESSTEDAFGLLMKNDEVSGTITWSSNGRRLTFTPTEELKKGSTYKVIVSFAAQDLAGNGLDDDREFSFETERAEEASFLGQYWWIIPLIVIVVLVIALVLWKLGKKPDVQDEVSEMEEGTPEEDV